jgi:hypothetical protein
VEPNLTLIQKMCDTLQVTPNELLGFADAGEQHAFEGPPGLSEAADGEPVRGSERDHTNGQTAGRSDPVGSLAWRLASEAVAMRQEHLGRKAASDPLEAVRETGTLFAALQAKPFATVAEIARDPALKGIDAARKAALAELIQSYTDRVATGATDKRRR